MRTNTVYLIHAERGIACRKGAGKSFAQHYLGSTSDLESRLAEHASGQGSPLIDAWNRLGIGWSVSRTWRGGRKLERKLKRRKNARGLCPACKEAA
jgi:predicted GIY-YIG superfamily endonuclease